jgi:mandelamide amidase
MIDSSRRGFLKATSMATLSSWAASLGLTACGGGGRGSGNAAQTLTVAQQLELTSSEAIEAIRSGNLSAETYVTTLLNRADSLQDLNMFITLNKAGALTAARSVDDRRKAGETLPPLAGLPIVVKDNINSRDLPTTGGTQALRDLRPRANAPSLQKLIDDGAIVLGKTNLHELAFGITSTNLTPFAGPVKNPYDKTRIPGGSSGGTAAAIAARIAPAGLGTDTGGSSRVPAALCGIVGLRPSVGNGGTERRYHDDNSVVPISHTRDTIGPMGRTVRDVALLDAQITSDRSGSEAIPLAGLRIGIPSTLWTGLDTSVTQVVNAARLKLEDAGVVFVDVDLEGIEELNKKISDPIALHEPVGDFPAYLEATGATGITLADVAAQVSSPDVRTAFSAILADVFGNDYPDAMLIHRPQLQSLYANYFAENTLDAVMFPTTILPATAIDAVDGSSTVAINGGEPVKTFNTYIRNTDPGSNAGIPGLSIPAGLTAEGLPVGLEFDAPLGTDTRLLGIGLSVEAVLGRLPAPIL